MLKIHQQKTSMNISYSQSLQFSQNINTQFAPLIFQSKIEYLKNLNLSPENTDITNLYPDISKKLSYITCGDFFIEKNNDFYFYKISVDKKELTAGFIANGVPKNFSAFIQEIEKTLKKLGGAQSVVWEDIKLPLEVTESIQADSLKIKPTKEELQAIKLLEDKSAFSVLKAISQHESFTLHKLLELYGKEKDIIEKHIAEFEKAGLISRDYVVLCRRTNQQILRVSSKEAIKETSQKDFKCFICGNPISSEKIDELINLSGFGKKIMEDDFWLLVKLYKTLEKLKIQKEQISIKPSKKEAFQNIFVNLNEQLALLILTNQELTLDDAFQISTIILAYQIPYIAVISTQPISYLMKNYLHENQPKTNFSFIEDLGHLEKNLKEFFDSIEQNYIKSIIQPLNFVTPVKIHNLILQKITAG